MTSAEVNARNAWENFIHESLEEYNNRQSFTFHPKIKCIDLVNLDSHISKLIKVYQMAEKLHEVKDVYETFVNKLSNTDDDEYVLETVDELIGQVLYIDYIIINIFFSL